jgi:hypothetical protein
VTSAPSYGRRRYSATESAAPIPIAAPVKTSQSSQDKRAEAALADEIDLLREENEFLLDKLRLTEEKVRHAVHCFLSVFQVHFASARF